MEDDRFVLRSITDEIMYELMLLSGQEYVDVYATSMKDRIARAAQGPATRAAGGRPAGQRRARSSRTRSTRPRAWTTGASRLDDVPIGDDER